MKKLNKIITMIMACALVMGLALTPALAMELAEADVSSGTLAAGTYEVTKDVDWSTAGNITLAAGDTTFNMSNSTIISMNGALVVGTGANLTVKGAEPASAPTATAETGVGALTTPNPTAQIVSKHTADKVESTYIISDGTTKSSSDKAIVVLQGDGNLTAENVAFVSDSTDTSVRGIVNNGTGTVDLDYVKVKSADVGVFLKAKGGKLDADHSVIEGTADWGVGVKNGATAEVSKSAITSKGIGILVDGEGSKVTADGVTVESKDNRGLGVQSGATAEVSKSTITSNKEGIYVGGKGSSVTAEGVTVKSDNRGLSVESGATAKVSKSTVTGTNYGIFVKGEDSRVTAEDVTVNSENRGLEVGSGATAEVSKTTITSNASSILVDGEDSSLTAEDVTVRSKNDRGLGVQDGATATVNGNSQIAGVNAIFVSNGANVTLNGTKVTGTRAAVVMSMNKANADEPSLTLGAGTTLVGELSFGKYDASTRETSIVGGVGYEGDNPQTVGTIVKYDGSVEYVGSTEVPQKVKDASCPKDGETVETPTGTWTAKVEVTGGEGNTKTASVTWTFVPKPVTPVYVYDPAQNENTENTEIADERVPLAAGPVSGNELVEYLCAGDEDAMAAFIAWAIEKGFIESEADLEELVTYGMLRTIMDAWCEYREIAVKFVCEGADDDIAVDAGALVEEFLRKVEE